MGGDVTTAAGVLPYRDARLPVAERVEDLLGRMGLDDKIGQMTQAERLECDEADVTACRLGSVLSGGGSVPEPNVPEAWADMYDGLQRAALRTPLGIPILYGVDAVHGHANVVGATVFPHNIGLGATRDPGLVREIGAATAREVAGTGITWNFAPCLGVVRNPRWGRTYESFGELSELPAAMASYITGLQGGPRVGPPPSVMATAKHFLGDGGTDGGDDQGDTRLSEAELRALHLPPFLEALRLGTGSVMVSLSAWNGVKVHGHRYLITDVLKGELGFTGLVVSDWNGLDEIFGREEFTGEEVRAAINAGIDMVMVPERWRRFIEVLRDEVTAGRVPMSRIDDANRRILTKKFEQGLFERPLADRSHLPAIGCAGHRALARRAVAASQVVLKDARGLLPLAPGPRRILVAGRAADDIGMQCGGWTISWQGSPGPITPGTTILDGIRAAAGPDATVVHDAGGAGIEASFDVAVAVVGEEPYAEDEGDLPGAMGLDAADLETLARLRGVGVPLVVVLVSGRPLDIAAELPGWDALVAAWLPGTEGQGVADVLFGAAPATGRLPVTWMRSAEQLPITDGDGQEPLFPYGHGLPLRAAGGVTG
ncbi:glycoside hydrolase family 3 protein [Actinomadura graeca]|uniref:beta-glucosidase n=1 Tax=Actinomadura graeca TaxID=2750812 RepID=A0ABX8QUE2_9ACTN|nr:glycoside hydrolase family 3 protein [Actinomadura graeca]QXJ22366.1 glycoside hydrolase family 3 protein [Actinomadura graeca]